MNVRRLSIGVLAFALLLALPASAAAAGGAPGATEGRSNAPVCPGPGGPDSARCHARVVTDRNGTPFVTALPSGYGPAQFHTAYNLPLTSSSSTLPIIGIVDAYNDPYIASDLNTYSSTFGIPSLPSCSGSIQSSSVACFAKLNQRGGTSYPKTNSGWALEISLDVEIAHAICQNCKILLIEADSNSLTNLAAAEDQAKSQGANVISNSWGSSEFSGELSYDSHFNIAGVAVTASSGDGGYGTEWPAASQYVTGVGGTSLYVNSNNTYNSESAWSGAGSGCSAYEPKPSWQTDAGCAMRTIADVSADADPNTGAAVYDSVRYNGVKGWFVVGGTSLASPLIASVYALQGDVTSGVPANSLPYGRTTQLHDVTTGSNGTCGSYLCNAGPGYDGPTGLGTPNGTGGF